MQWNTDFPTTWPIGMYQENLAESLYQSTWGFAVSGSTNADTSKPFTHPVSSGLPINQLDSAIRQALDAYPHTLIANLKIAKINSAQENSDTRKIGDRICAAIESTKPIDRLTNLTELGKLVASL